MHTVFNAGVVMALADQLVWAMELGAAAGDPPNTRGKAFPLLECLSSSPFPPPVSYTT